MVTVHQTDLGVDRPRDRLRLIECTVTVTDPHNKAVWLSSWAV